MAVLLAGAIGGWIAHGVRPAPPPAPEDIVAPAKARRAEALLADGLAGGNTTAKVITAPAWQAEQLPPADAPARAATLRALADEGNAYAAHAYAEVLEECRFYRPASPEEVDKRIASRAVLQTQLQRAQVESIEKALDTDLPEPPADDLAAAKHLLNEEERLAHTCAGVDAALAQAEWSHWFEQAAALGHPDAQVGYLESLVLRDWAHPAERARRKAQARTYLAAAMSRGDARALTVWAEALARGVYAEPDAFLAYAFTIAGVQSAGLAQRAMFSLVTSRQHPVLSASEVRAAKALGREIHQRCCSRTRN